MDSQTDKAMRFRQLHRGPGVLILTNAWDVASARIFEEAGLPAIATTSAGIAYSLGYPDGQRISREEMIARIGRIARAVKVPVTADIEAGYGSTPEDAARTTRELVQAGAIGMNLEDASGDPERPLVELPLAVEKIKASRVAAAHLRVPMVVNARTDVYLLPGGDPQAQYAEALRRLIAYRDAGADCVFAPGLKDAETIGRLVKDVRCPLNVLAAPGTPAIPELERLGVARVSLGSGPMRATLGLLRRMAEELKTAGTYSALEGAVPYAEVNKILGA
ncbi:MAG: isocitrate lyase/phosphoenolpyruvate mutase family protein [Acidobacteriales bacterium]|nr:isocitrate lyase/phosphoenolpyruvate mutase family protein [Candidatus Koribacter versatilis]MBI3645705.1 isocitrate lyase/phosphoenolpyruvate mutase family protein [Terriglobales bacterium]